MSTGRKADFGKIHTFPHCFFGIFWLSRLTCISDTRLSDKNDSQGDGGDSSGGSWVGSLHLELIVIGNGDLAAPKLGWILEVQCCGVWSSHGMYCEEDHLWLIHL